MVGKRLYKRLNQACGCKFQQINGKFIANLCFDAQFGAKYNEFMGFLGGSRAFRATPQLPKTGRPVHGSSSQGRSAAPGPAAVSALAG